MTFANWLTVGRILLVPFFITSLVYYEPGREFFRLLAFWIFIAASVTDALDGYIARNYHQKTTFGTFLDPLADKVLVISGFLAVALSSAFHLKPPAWIVIVIVSRDVVIVAGLILVNLSTGNIEIKPNWLGKVTTFCQLVTLATILVQWPVARIFWYLTAALTILSGIFYVIREGKRLNGSA